MAGKSLDNLVILSIHKRQFNSTDIFFIEFKIKRIIEKHDNSLDDFFPNNTNLISR